MCTFRDFSFFLQHVTVGYLFLVRQPPVGQGLLINEVSRSHTTTHHSLSSGRVNSSSQRPLPDNTRHSQQTKIHATRWDPNPQSQQASGRRTTPLTTRPLGPAQHVMVQFQILYNICIRRHLDAGKVSETVS